MTVSTTSPDDISGFFQNDIGSLVVHPTAEASIAFQVSDVDPTSLHEIQYPIITDDAPAGWVNEGDEIVQGDPTFDTITVTARKVAGITPANNEALDDSEPELDEQLGRSLGRAIAVRVDEAYFGNLALPAPPGLEALGGAVTTVFAGGDLTNLDVFAEAIALSADEGGDIRFFIANPLDRLAIAKLKKATDSVEPLLGMDATQPGAQQIFGVPMLRSKAVPVGTIWGIDPEYSKLVLRKDIDIAFSDQAQFTRDRTLVRGIMRVGFGFPHPKALVRIELSAGGS